MIGYFLAALASPKSEVRGLAIRALGQPKQVLAPQVTEALLTVAQRDNTVGMRAAALEILGQLSWRRSVPGLAEMMPAMLRDSQPEIRAAAAAALDTVLVEVPSGPFLMGSEQSKELVKKSRILEKLVHNFSILRLVELRLGAGRWFFHKFKGSQAYDDEMPQHTGVTQAYRIAKYPVTNAQFERFVVTGGYDNRAYWTEAGWKWKGDRSGPEHYGGELDQPEHPVVGISWYEAVAYCRWLAENTRHPYRLPTEVEWEKAARGTDGRIWPWGDQFDSAKCNTGEGGSRRTTPVTKYPEGTSPYGCYDMAGNVWEWTSTLYKPYPYKPDDGREDPNAEGPRVLRGGSWGNTAGRARSAARLADPPDAWAARVGLRCVVAPQGSPKR